MESNVFVVINFVRNEIIDFIGEDIWVCFGLEFSFMLVICGYKI